MDSSFPSLICQIFTSSGSKTCGESKDGPAVLLGRKGTVDIPRYIEGKYWNVDTAFDVKTDETSLLLKYYFYLSLQGYLCRRSERIQRRIWGRGNQENCKYILPQIHHSAVQEKLPAWRCFGPRYVNLSTRRPRYAIRYAWRRLRRNLTFNHTKASLCMGGLLVGTGIPDGPYN